MIEGNPDLLRLAQFQQVLTWDSRDMKTKEE